jgi:hypothetical protein
LLEQSTNNETCSSASTLIYPTSRAIYLNAALAQESENVWLGVREGHFDYLLAFFLVFIHLLLLSVDLDHISGHFFAVCASDYILRGEDLAGSKREIRIIKEQHGVVLARMRFFLV